ncbi:MAG: type II toxin-antitoxin system VapC family toxin [Deltaproteobacteria bacterium]|nr:type II toxin-antitoxin system VapC family toxin [Deltaproteobacteria bacterium]
MRYLLDTDTCIFLINRSPGYEAVLAHLEGLVYGEVLLSAITLAELRFGVAKSARGPANLERLERFLARFEVADFDAESAAAYGSLRADLEGKGTPIGPFDTLIAAQALSRDAVLVTNNVREFSRVAGLRWENWMASASA